jgi:drug/metabolite transporter (DMT)-like permease
LTSFNTASLSKRLKAHIALLIVALIYGSNYSIAKVVLDEEYMQPLGFILLRVISGLLLFHLFHLLFVREKIRKSDWWLFLLCGLFGVALNQMFFFIGLKKTTPINASLIMTTTPILVLLISALMIGERITLRKVAGILTGAAGAILLITYGQQIAFKKEGLIGDLFVLANATSYGIYLVLVKTLMRRYHPITVVKWVFTFGVVFVLPFGGSDLLATEWGSFPAYIWAAVAFVLLFTTFIAYLFNAYALVTVNPSVVSIYIYLQPLFATAIALLMTQDQLDWIKIVSAALIFAGVYLASFKPAAKG